MAGLNETPRGNRIHIAFFGLRNAGKSTLVNAFTGQPIAIVSDVPGTTTDPVSKAMEILPLGPCLVTDTAGLDDEGELGEMRVEKTLKVLETTDIAIWVGEGFEKWRSRFSVPVLEYRRGDSVEELKRRIAAVKVEEPMPGLLDGLVEKGDRVLCVVPIDESAPKGRLILPQQQVIRECLDRHVACTVCQPEELFDCSECSIVRMTGRTGRVLVVTDSQAFGRVNECVKHLNRTFEHSEHSNIPNNQTITLTSFSILFARQKGDLAEYVKGLEAIASLRDGDAVLIAEGCTHHRQCNDIGTTKIPKALERLSGKRLRFEFASGTAFVGEGRNGQDARCPSEGGMTRKGQDARCPSEGGMARDGQDARCPGEGGPEARCALKLIVQCGGCMLTRREMLRRIAVAKEAGVPIVNYGMVLAAANGLAVEDVLPSYARSSATEASHF